MEATRRDEHTEFTKLEWISPQIEQPQANEDLASPQRTKRKKETQTNNEIK